MTTRLEKPVRRVVEIAGALYVVELTRAGIQFREHGHRHRVVAPWRSVHQMAERLAGEQLHREQLRDKALRRMVRAIAIAAVLVSSTRCGPLTEPPPGRKCKLVDTIYVQLDSLPATITVRRCP
jgi:hypothetical protein